ncbi:hypothetical protein FA95DRAFT_1602941 [Auriscalpium vulgare]|uniref:Uncharacterized protein n=1 Tax=Auriscalpium vulgare TaxID=40419 RepID=A0ACB8S5G9_9AGAM|nr:hypothetical protein FA95DRAFT_1602941 [Auriscalpium vulgare]
MLVSFDDYFGATSSGNALVPIPPSETFDADLDANPEIAAYGAEWQPHPDIGKAAAFIVRGDSLPSLFSESAASSSSGESLSTYSGSSTVPSSDGHEVIIGSGSSESTKWNADFVEAITISLREFPRKYQCHLCPRSFSREWNLNKHIEGPHLGKTPFACVEVGCKYAGARKETLKRHMEKIHKKEFPGGSRVR